jgi:hypothetical protein
MSTDYRPLKEITSNDLFDGRLEAFGVHESCNEYTTEASRCLTDGHTYLWVYVTNGLAKDFMRSLSSDEPRKILKAIAKAFDVTIVSEHEPEYWGFDTQEEWDAAWEAIAKEYDERFYTEIVKFLNGDPHDIGPGTVGMLKAEIAKKLVEEDPTLVLPTNKDKLRAAINATYNRDHAVIIDLGSEDLAFMEMMATHEDDLPKA